ncbi:MAG: flippase-like domain-containing protein [Candidatus Moranbacteria bacterium]|nr:flippase-like domain-containing protein [Candidatus Moranbacteria bacterium]
MITEPVGGKTESGLSKLPIAPLLTSFIVIFGISVALFERFGDFGLLLGIFREAEPWWLVAAVAFQVLTYVSAGEVWNVAMRAAGRPLRKGILARLAIERMTIDQFMPSAGIAGHLGTLQALRHFGVTFSVAMEAIFVDLISHFVAYVAAAIAAFVLLSMQHEITPVVMLTLGAFAVIASVMLTTTVLFLRNRDLVRIIPSWISKRKRIARLLAIVSQISTERILDRNVSVKSVFFQSCIFILDGVTLWASLRAVGEYADPAVCFASLVIALVAGTVLFIPGGVGVFEVGSVTTLVGLGVSFEGALAGTLLFRGLSLWIPLIPGVFLAHQDLGVGFSRKKKPDVSCPIE